MRDLVLLVIILASIPVAFFEPYYGILVWIWIAYFNPHRYTFSYMYNFPVAMVIAIPTILGLFFTRKVNRNILTKESLLLFALWIWFFITFLNAMQVPFFAGHIGDAQFELTRVSKTLLMTVVAMLVITSRQRLKYVFLVTAFSFSLLVFKATLFGLQTSGQDRVWGPPDSFLADNNGFALAINMSLPILFYLARVEENRVLRRILNVAFVAGVISVILTYSRGGFLGLAAVLCAIAMKSKYRVLSGIGLAVCGLLILTLAPQQWMDRIGTLTVQKEDMDSSARERLVSWGTTWNFSKDYPIAGGSFDTLPDVQIFQKYQSEPLPPGFPSSGPHSIYFQMIGEQGYVGLILYLLLIGCSIGSLRRLSRFGRQYAPLSWVIPYSDALQVSFVGFLVSGAFLGLANFDLFYQLVACTVAMQLVCGRELTTCKLKPTVTVPSLSESSAFG